MNETMGPNGNGYKIDIGIFQGPLDLLLYLIKKEEFDIYDIPLAKITSEYLKYVELMHTLNLEIAGEFILMAATLIRIKTRMLLPRDESDPEEPDPREELILALIEYKKYKEAGEILRDKALLEERNLVPPSLIEKENVIVDWLPGTTLYDLLAAFREVLKSRRDDVFHNIDAESVSAVDRMQHIVTLLRQREYALFHELFADAPVKIVAIVTFIALLELVRTRRITVNQSRPFAELRVYRGEAYTETLATDVIEENEMTEEEVTT
jgi:segregation and condensation protein A